jgi:hypothetical protein
VLGHVRLEQEGPELMQRGEERRGQNGETCEERRQPPGAEAMRRPAMER